MKLNSRFAIMALALFSYGQTFSQMVILSGPEKGSYNRFVNDMVSVLGEKCRINLVNRPSGGSGYNFKGLVDPSSGYKIALIQSDYLNLMKAEDKLNNTNKTGPLKVVLQIAREEIQVITKKSGGIYKLQDLDRKKVAIGNEDQGSFATGKTIRDRSKVNWSSYYIGFDQLLKELSSGTVDAGLIVGSAPMDMLDIDPQVMSDGIRMLELDDFNGWAKYYENDTVYRSEYKWLDKNIPTFAVRTLLVVNDSKLTAAERQTVNAIKSGIIENLDILKLKGHPKWKETIIPDEVGSLTVKNTVSAAKSQPAGAKQSDKVTYRVQIYSRNYEKKEDMITVNGKSYKPYVYLYLGAYRYTIGEFSSLSSAAELQNICRETGYSEAFVAAFRNNERSTDPALFK
jgi:uncharacterized protein